MQPGVGTPFLSRGNPPQMHHSKLPGGMSPFVSNPLAPTPMPSVPPGVYATSMSLRPVSSAGSILSTSNPISALNSRLQFDNNLAKPKPAINGDTVISQDYLNDRDRLQNYHQQHNNQNQQVANKIRKKSKNRRTTGMLSPIIPTSPHPMQGSLFTPISPVVPQTDACTPAVQLNGQTRCSSPLSTCTAPSLKMTIRWNAQQSHTVDGPSIPISTSASTIAGSTNPALISKPSMFPISTAVSCSGPIGKSELNPLGCAPIITPKLTNEPFALQKDVATCTSDCGTMTEPELLGPCEPGSRLLIEGVIWLETPSKWPLMDYG